MRLSALSMMFVGCLQLCDRLLDFFFVFSFCFPLSHWILLSLDFTFIGIYFDWIEEDVYEEQFN